MLPLHASSAPPDTRLEQLTRKRAAAKLGWYVHATVYLLVNLLLVALWVSSRRHWAVFPLLGWGLGLAVHGAVVFLVTGGAGIHERLVQQERERLTLQCDPW